MYRGKMHVTILQKNPICLIFGVVSQWMKIHYMLLCMLKIKVFWLVWKMNPSGTGIV